ncbi:sugar-binding transcriptional regulator [Bauldia litoralis]|uniref:DNA-binding transcriptional regulator LsrR, DeoR family n=1 Tax=Bauldia litoralis TaxID=665467 RepID=A0A1G6BW88_9HYPH|nr:sugar-binding transcriptional regulator [Bauldia litoralis]SDB24913.1 DNA-binding transcriptional regulator LsrR, DeoR family [Bauldia litoralis]
MDMNAPGEESLLVRLAWLYYVAGLNQEEIARRLQLSRFKVTRMLAQAREKGIVKISLDQRSSETLDLGHQLSESFGLTECIVTPPLGSEGDEVDATARRAVGIAAAALLGRRLQTPHPVTVGLSWGRTVASLVAAFPATSKPDVRFVSLMGSLSRTARSNPFDMVHALAQACGGEAYVLPTPYLVDSESDFDVVMNQSIVREALAIGSGADFYISSFGVCSRESFIYDYGLIGDAEIDELINAGAVGDMLGKFFDAEGNLVASSLNRRTPSVSLEAIRDRDLVLLAAGLSKSEALRAVLRTGLVNRLVIDGDLARSLLPHAPAPSA